MIPRVTRRLVDRERKMITSGSVFVFDESESGIKRWTDGLLWSPSRILGNFLVRWKLDRVTAVTDVFSHKKLYRETDKRTTGSQSRSSQLMQSEPSPPSQPLPPPTTTTPTSASSSSANTSNGDPTTPDFQSLSRPKHVQTSVEMDKSRERTLFGSLTNSQKFKQDGMMKKVRCCSYLLTLIRR
jgi:hypothetical protein